MPNTYTVTLANQDITRYVTNIPSFVDSVGLYGQITVNQINSITGINANGFWDAENPASPFYHADPKGYQIEITKNGIPIFSGKILSISIAGRTATVNLQSALTKAFESGCIYLSEEIQTPAEAVRDICLLYEIPIETASFTASNAEYSDNNVWIEVFSPRPDQTVFQVLQAIAEIGVAALSVVKGKLRFDLYRRRDSPGIVTISDSKHQRDSKLLSIPAVTTIEKDRTVGYSIQTVQGIASLGSEIDQGKTISAGVESIVQIKTLSAGIWIGEKWIEYLNRPQNRVTFTTAAGIGRDLPLLSPIDIEYTGGGWNQFTADAVSIDVSSLVNAVVTAETR